MKFKLKKWSIFIKQKETIGVLVEHFHHVRNRKMAVEWNFIENISPNTNKTMHEIGGPMTLDKLNAAISQLAWHKAPGRNDVSPNAIKALNDENRMTTHLSPSIIEKLPP